MKGKIMQKDELIETIDTFIEKNRDMLKFTASDKLIDGNGNIINGRNGWEKWLQFQFAKYLSENKYKQITVENKFERNNTKNKDNVSRTKIKIDLISNFIKLIIFKIIYYFTI